MIFWPSIKRNLQRLFNVVFFLLFIFLDSEHCKKLLYILESPVTMETSIVWESGMLPVSDSMCLSHILSLWQGERWAYISAQGRRLVGFRTQKTQIGQKADRAERRTTGVSSPDGQAKLMVEGERDAGES